MTTPTLHSGDDRAAWGSVLQENVDSSMMIDVSFKVTTQVGNAICDLLP